MHFYKYHGAGNDFIMVDQRQHTWLNTNHTARIAALCERRFGIGADGLILLEPHETLDFSMIYFNADGLEGTLCGNGGRCAAAFAHRLGLIGNSSVFQAADGPHEAILLEGGRWVELRMAEVRQIEHNQQAIVVDTGSPHYVEYRPTIDLINVKQEGASVRYSDRYHKAGINVNFIEDNGPILSIRTYERGVEDETWACGTGVVAAALAEHRFKQLGAGSFIKTVRARGGAMQVRFDALADGSYTQIWLCGPAEYVYEGDVSWD
jgi:diaminopimelate epimerase